MSPRCKPNTPFTQKFGHSQCVGREGLNLIVHRLSALIIDKGYSTTRVVIGPQNLSSGKLELQLIPGVISDIRFADSKIYGTWRNAFPTRPGDLLNLREIEQGLEQLKRVPNQDVSMQIVPGPSPGESDIVIAVKRSKPWSISIGADDAGLKSTGRYEADTNLALYNPLGLSDIFSIGYSHDIDGHENQDGTHGSNAAYSIPWGNWTFSLNGSQYDYHQNIAGSVSTIQSSGVSEIWDAKTEYMFYRNQVQKNQLEFQVGKYYAQSFIDGTSLDVQHRDNTYAEIGWEHKHYRGGLVCLDSIVRFISGTPEAVMLPI
ncbi:ShlB/FhaC/HecB family hemolysin secretion/activation protein [Bordetella sp. FB-8]|uniref:ShlB/FhaC/HecB family hemolysin secretion/activation protein n=1 Tax=Bordetella sp. FB-8 TaxID=1159870 RepID=UPI0009D945CE|nr:ShlB/FhaC/HecB family hemolysin secretion/activation protein [Bordetella sp. FB-8]